MDMGAALPRVANSRMLDNANLRIMCIYVQYTL